MIRERSFFSTRIILHNCNNPPYALFLFSGEWAWSPAHDYPLIILDTVLPRSFFLSLSLFFRYFVFNLHLPLQKDLNVLKKQSDARRTVKFI